MKASFKILPILSFVFLMMSNAFATDLQWTTPVTKLAVDKMIKDSCKESGPDIRQLIGSYKFKTRNYKFVSGETFSHVFLLKCLSSEDCQYKIGFSNEGQYGMLKSIESNIGPSGWMTRLDFSRSVNFSTGGKNDDLDGDFDVGVQLRTGLYAFCYSSYGSGGCIELIKLEDYCTHAQ